MARSLFHCIVAALTALSVFTALCIAQEEFEPVTTAEIEISLFAVGDQLLGDGFESVVDSVDSAGGVNYASLILYDWLTDAYAYAEVFTAYETDVSFVMVTDLATGDSESEWFSNVKSEFGNNAGAAAMLAAPKVNLKPLIDAIKKWWSKPKPPPKPAPAPPPQGKPKPTPKFQPPTNPPQRPPTTVPAGHRVRQMPPTAQYPNGYWRLEKQLPDGNWQPINPSMMKPGTRPETHVPLPPPNPPTTPGT